VVYFHDDCLLEDADAREGWPLMKLEYTFKNDMLFKMVFVKYPDLLKRLVAELLGIRLESIREFAITNPEMPPEAVGDKFCRLDINMTVDGQRVDLEIQVADEGDYPERSLYYWAREYSSALGEGGKYSSLPRTIIISIMAFTLFDCEEFHSEYQPLEVTRHTPLTDRQVSVLSASPTDRWLQSVLRGSRWIRDGYFEVYLFLISVITFC
jgi:predicted transposase/invertase (TIGR01784 family)